MCTTDRWLKTSKWHTVVSKLTLSLKVVNCQHKKINLTEEHDYITGSSQRYISSASLSLSISTGTGVNVEMVSRTDEWTSREEPGLREAWRTLRSPHTTEKVPNSPHQALRSRKGDHTAGFWWALLLERRPRSAVPILRITAVERASCRTEMSKVRRQRTSPGEMSGMESGATGNLWGDVPVP